MPAFTAIGAYVAGTLLGLVGTAATIVGAVVATGSAYITSRIINGNQNKGNNSANTQGGRIQVPPATNNKIPVVYGSAYVNGIITDARLVNQNKTMYYCLVLSEYTNNYTTPTYGLESVVWNDLRLTAVDATTNAHKVKDGRKVVNGAIVTAGAFVTNTTYVITKRGTTDFTLIGAQTNNIGQVFTATGLGTGTGQAQEEDFKDEGFIVDGNSLVELRVYAGGSSAAEQIYPPQSTGNTANAYTFWAGNDGSWDNTYTMDGLVFAIVKMTYGQNGFTSLPNVTFQLANNVANPADVWYDYMTSKRYGAGIPISEIDTSARTAWYDFCEEDISYTGANLNPAGGSGTSFQQSNRYQINGIIDTSNQVKTNIDTIMQNGGAWLSYNVATGLWSPVIKKAVSSGETRLTTDYFIATKSGFTLTVSSFSAGRIEPGQNLYNSSGTFIGTVDAQLFPLQAGESTGQAGRYTISVSGTISSPTFFFTLPSSILAFSDNNIISGITLSSTRLDDLYNKVEVEFYDKYNKDQKSYARLNLPTNLKNPNEPDNQLRMSLDLCNNSVQAQLLGQLELRQSRDDLVIEFTSNHYGIQAQAGDVISVTNSIYGWAPKYFRVMRVKEQETEEGGLVAQIEALEYNGDVYTVEPISEFSTAANIDIGNLISSVGLPAPTTPVISNRNPGDSIPNFTFSFNVPSTGGPFDEAEIYYTEGWDQNLVTGTIVPGTGSNGVPVGKGLMTVTAVTYNSINVGDYFDLGNGIVESQLTQTTISTKTFASGGAVGATTFVINNNTGVVIGQKPTGTGIPSGAMVIGVSGTTVTLDKAFTVQATGSYLFTTEGGTGTYQLSVSTTASGSDYLFDQPLETDFAFLKKVVPDGNATVFASPSTVSILVTELPANSQTFRRYFLKARLGNKKNFGAFSPNTPIDIDGNNVNWQPNPVAAGSLADLSDVLISPNPLTAAQEGETLYYDSTVGKWKNNSILKVNDSSTGVEIYNSAGTRVRRTTSFTNISATSLTVSGASTGTPAVGFGTAIAIENEVQPNVFKVGAFITSALTDVTAGSEDAELFFQVLTNGSVTTPLELIGNNATIAGNLTLNGSTSGSTTLSAGATPTPTTYTLPSADGTANQVLKTNGSGVLSWGSGSVGGGDVLGPASATDNAVARFDTTTGKLLKNSGVIIDNSNNITGAYSITSDYSLTVPLITTAAGYPLGISAYLTSPVTITANSVTGAGSNGIVLTADSCTGPVKIVRNVSSTPNQPYRSLTLLTSATTTPTTGFGNTLAFEVETSPTVEKQIATIETRSTNLASGSESFNMNFYLMKSGTLTEVMKLDSVGHLQIDGHLTVSGDEIKSSSLFTAMTLNNSDVRVENNLTVKRLLITETSEDVANAAAISLTTPVSYFSTGATGETATLAAGTEGQFKSLMMVADGGGDMVVTVSNAGWKSSGTGTITFDAIGESCFLQYINSKWFAVGANGVTFA